MSGDVMIFNKKFKRHYCRNKKRIQIVIYIITDVFSGRESKKGGK